MLANVFGPATGGKWYLLVIFSVVISLAAVAALMQTPPRFRRPLVVAITFLSGLVYALEYFLPTQPHPIASDPKHVSNYFTAWLVPLGECLTVLVGFTVGLGVISLIQVHGKRLLRGAAGAFNSLAFFLTLIAMAVVGVLTEVHPNSINKNLNTLLFDGALSSMSATMFSIIAFYIASAAYRAFRIRSFEASLLLITATLVMLGQFALGIALTRWIPADGFGHNLHVEVIRDWILTKANAPAFRAINFGIGVGSLAIALRIWLGLERGGYFD